MLLIGSHRMILRFRMLPDWCPRPRLRLRMLLVGSHRMVFRSRMLRVGRHGMSFRHGVLRHGSHWVRFLCGAAWCCGCCHGTRCGQVMRHGRSHWVHTMISHDRLADDHFGRTSVIDCDEVGAVDAGFVLHLDLGRHGLSVGFA